MFKFVRIFRLRTITFTNQNLNEIIPLLLEFMVNNDEVFKNKQMLRYL